MNEAASVMERRRIEALREAENGNPAKLDALLADPAVSNRVKERVTIASEAAGVRDSLAGQDPAADAGSTSRPPRQDRQQRTSTPPTSSVCGINDTPTEALINSAFGALLAGSRRPGAVCRRASHKLLWRTGRGIDARRAAECFRSRERHVDQPSSTGRRRLRAERAVGLSPGFGKQARSARATGRFRSTPAAAWPTAIHAGATSSTSATEAGFAQSYSVTIDNSHVAGDFHYLLNGEPATVRAGERREHQLKQAPQIAFDRGDGQTVRRELSEGSYQVGIDVQRRVFGCTPTSIQSVSRNEFVLRSACLLRARQSPSTLGRASECNVRATGFEFLDHGYTSVGSGEDWRRSLRGS